MLDAVKPLIRRALRRLGYDVRPYQPNYFPELQLKALLRSQGTDLVLDVGANAGQFGMALREIGYAGRIVSFEPLAAAREQLLAASAGDPQWQVAERCAIGEEDAELDIHVAGNSVSSSVLPMLDAHLRTAPESRYVATERVALRRLDSVAPSYIDGSRAALLKIDTQGYEDRVLDGATGSVAGSNVGATKEAGEPNPVPNNTGGASVWYRWTAPAGGSTTITTFGLNGLTLMMLSYAPRRS